MYQDGNSCIAFKYVKDGEAREKLVSFVEAAVLLERLFAVKL